ncbi:MAG: N-acetylglucosamine-6-phosphate deacetylase, partial [Vicinamibacterales bacterium]
LVIEGDRIAHIITDALGAERLRPERGAGGERVEDAPPSERERGWGHASIEKVNLHGHIVVPGFIDVHVHGLDGLDTLDGGDVIAGIAQRLPKFGVTSFCPTTVACAPDALRGVLRSVAALRAGPNGVLPAEAVSARVLAAHLESNFINPEYRGAQPIGCLRLPPSQARSTRHDHEFNGRDILAEIDTAGDSVGIVTLAPELEGALDLIRHLVSSGRRVSLGHSGATLAQSRAAIDAGARHATHLFNRMPPLDHREPGLAGAILASAEVAAEIICDGVHVHRDMVRLAIAAKGAARMMAITDGVAAAGLSEGSTALLGGRTIRVRDAAAYLEDGTLAGSVATMDRVFRFLINDVGLSLNDAAQLCATTPASELGLTGTGSITEGAIADLVVMDRDFTVMQTYVGGRLAHSAM